MKLSNAMYAGKTLVTGFGPISFDQDGNANVSDEAVEALTKLPGFSTDYTTPADEDTGDNDQDKGEQEGDKAPGGTDSGDGEHAEGGEQDKSQGEGDTTQNGDESGENDDKGEAGDELTEEQLKKLQVPSLKKLCKERGLDIGSRSTKQPLIDLLLGR